MSEAGRWRRWHAVVLVCVVVVLAVVWIYTARTSAAADGTSTYPSTPLWGNGVVLANVVEQPGLRPGDRVVAVDGRTLEDWITAGPGRDFEPGDQLRYAVERSDGSVSRTIDVAVTVLRYPLGEMSRQHLSPVPLLVAMLGVTTFLLLRRPDSRAARALFATTAFLPFGATNWPLPTQVIDLLNGPRIWPTVLGDTANGFVWATLLHFVLVFPSPLEFVERRPRLILACYALPFALHAAYLAVMLPFAANRLEVLGRVLTVSSAAAHIVPLLVVAVIFARYRAAQDIVLRRQIRLVFVTILGAAVSYVGFGQLPDRLLGHPLISWEWQVVLFLSFPIALVIGVLRHRLFEINIIVRRSLVFGGLTLGLAVVYVVSFALLGRFLDAETKLAPLLATAVVAVLFQPLQAWLQRTVSKVLFGDRDDPYQVLYRLGDQLKVTAAADTVLTTIVETLAQALRLPFAAIELVSPEGVIDAARCGHPQGRPLSISLTHQGEEVGRLVLDTGRSREPFGPADRKLLDTLALQVAAIAHNVLLNIQLQRSLEQVVTTREEERRRLRRDIHDGIGPLLAANSMRLEVVRRLVRSDIGKAEVVLEDLARTQQDLITDIRRLVEGLRPPVLDQLGLVSAIEEGARSLATGGPDGLRIHVDADAAVEPLPAAVEVAAYHIIIEAMTNVARHADADDCVIKLRRGNALFVQIEDDGRGLPNSYRAGVGLHSMRERATQVGGTFAISSASGAGTAVRVRLPLPQRPE